MSRAERTDVRGAVVRKVIVSVLLIAIIVVAGTGAARAFIKYRPEAEQQAVAVNPGYTVEIEQVQFRDYRHYITGFGTAAPLRMATLSAEVGGIVRWIDESLRVGSSIEEGTLIFRIDDASSIQELTRRKSLLDEAEATLKRIDQELINTIARTEVVKEEQLLIQQEVKRQEDLGKAGAGTEQALDQARRQLKGTERALLEIENQLQLRKHDRDKVEISLVARKAEVELARLDVARCEIRAPFSGVISERYVEVGELVRPGMNLFRIVDLSVVEVPIEVPASEVGAIALHSPVTLMLPQDPAQSWKGAITRIAPEVDLRNRTTAIYVQVDNRGLDPKLRIGQLVEARIEGAYYTGVVVIPRRALVDGFAFVKKGNRAERRKPEVLRALGDDLILENGIETGEELIVTNLELLFDGADVITSAELNRRMLSDPADLPRNASVESP